MSGKGAFSFPGWHRSHLPSTSAHGWFHSQDHCRALPASFSCVSTAPLMEAMLARRKLSDPRCSGEAASSAGSVQAALTSHALQVGGDTAGHRQAGHIVYAGCCRPQSCHGLLVKGDGKKLGECQSGHCATQTHEAGQLREGGTLASSLLSEASAMKSLATCCAFSSASSQSICSSCC